MVREFSEEKRDKIFRALDVIDNREWKSFMTWCGGKVSEFGDWPDRIELRTHTNYVDDYHQKILDTNEMTRNQVNAVFENVAEIDTRYAGLMGECQDEIKVLLAIIQTMIEVMMSMNGGNHNMALLVRRILNESGISTEENEVVTETYCYWVRDRLSLDDYGIDKCLDFIGKLYNMGFVSYEDYKNIYELAEEIKALPKEESSAEADELEEMMLEYFDHVITTVYIYNCLQVLASEKFMEDLTPELCCENNDIFRNSGITNRNAIACFLICCAGETGGFKDILENCGDDIADRGAGYLQLTGHDLQQKFLEYMNIDVDPNLPGYAKDVAEEPWISAAWFYGIYQAVGTKNPESLNDYIMERMDENGGELTLGLVLTAESFVNGKVRETNDCGTSTMDDALHVIARYDSLRHIDGEDDNGWYIKGTNTNCRLHILADMVAIPDNEDGTPASDIPSEWNSDNWLIFEAPNNWNTFVEKYNALREYGLIDFDLNTELP